MNTENLFFKNNFKPKVVFSISTNLEKNQKSSMISIVLLNLHTHFQDISLLSTHPETWGTYDSLTTSNYTITILSQLI